MSRAKNLGIPACNVNTFVPHRLGKKCRPEPDDAFITQKLCNLSFHFSSILLLTADQDANRKTGEPPTIIGAVQSVLEITQRCLSVAHLSIFAHNWWKLCEQFPSRLKLFNFEGPESQKVLVEVRT